MLAFSKRKMNKFLYIVLVCGLFSCKKESIKAFTEEEESIIHVQTSALEIATKIVAYHEMMINGSSMYNQGAVVCVSDTVGTIVYDTLTYHKISDNPYIHSSVNGYTSSVRDTAISTTAVTIKLNNFMWNNMVFSGNIEYNYNSLSIVTINIEGLNVSFNGKASVVQGVLFANKSGVNHAYTGYLNGTGDLPFQWQTTQSFVCFGDYQFADINSIPNATLFVWKYGAAELQVDDKIIEEKIDVNFYQINKMMVINANGDRRILEYPFL